MRDDRRIEDGEQLLVRMNDDRDVANALKLALALANAPAYRVVPGFERSGPLTDGLVFRSSRRDRGPDRRARHAMVLVRL